jgi:periplasmic protein TonB
MPRDLFGDVSNPARRVGSRKWYTVPLSMAAHTLALVLLVLVPLMATGVLPTPHDGSTVMLVEPPPLPSPPPVTVRRNPETPSVNPNVAPTEAPAEIAPEPPDLDTEFQNTGDGIGVVGLGDGKTVDDLMAPPPPPPPPSPPQEPVRPGGQVRIPQKVHDVAPAYPVVAKEARIQGVVIIEAVIGTDGRVTNARVLRSLPFLDDAALVAVRQWVYTPTTLNGVPVPVIMTVTVQFKLN